MGDVLLVAARFAAAGAMAALSVALLALRFRSRASRALALLLLLQGLAFLGLGLLPLGGPGAQGFIGALLPYVYLSQVPTVVYLGIAFLAPQRDRLVRPAGWAMIVAGLALSASYLADHCTVVCPSPEGLVAGPLYVLAYGGVTLAIAAVGLALAFAGARMPPTAQRSCTLLVAAALALNALLDGILQGMTLVSAGLWADYLDDFAGTGIPVAASLVRLVSLPVALAALVVAVRVHGAEQDGRHRAAMMAALGLAVLGAVAIAGLYVLYPADSTGTTASFGTLLTGIWRIVTPALVAYGLLKHKLFAFDPVLKAAIGPTTIASLFLAVFFAVSKVMENLLGSTYGAVYGGVAAGLLLFALSPLERLGHRVAHALMPRTKQVSAMDADERTLLYRDQASLVWSDGVMRAAERALLDRLRDRLGIAPQHAAEIERTAFEAAAQAPVRPRGRPRSTHSHPKTGARRA